MQGELVCAWCNTKKKDVELVTQGTSHGICADCLLKVFGFTAKTLATDVERRKQQAKAIKREKARKRREAKKRRASHVR